MADSTTIRGKAYVLGDDIDTDQIIPAEHLYYSMTDPEERKLYGKYANVGVPEGQRGLPDGNIPFVAEGETTTEYPILIGGRNFGCGSSREHAPFALAEAGAKAVVAEFYARIFFRNCVNGGFLVPCEATQRLIDKIRTGDDLEIDVEAGTLTNHTTGDNFTLKPLGEVKPIIDAGGVFAYARQTGML
ncbi:MAG: 3-isopropylmalate dehydratase [Phycisphaeraceae bacterium]